MRSRDILFQSKSIIHTVLIIFIFQITMPSIGKAQNAMKVMSFNIRTSHGQDGVNSWENRKSFVLSTLKKDSPDVIGFQELTPEQHLFLSERLKNYHCYAVGRKDGKLEDEITAIYYKKKFDVLKDSTIWLSEHPSEIGSKSWDAALYRTVSWVILRSKTNNKSVMIVNTHFDHIGKVARENSAKMIVKLGKDNNPGIPMVVMGDFNTLSTDAPYQVLTGQWAATHQLKDARLITMKPHKGGEVTYNGYKDDQGKIIDFIFVSDGINVKSHRYMNLKKGEVYISDHYPVEVEIEITKDKIALSPGGKPLE
ncbi:MAG: endonuclease/exonuclease/phosphatase family protein [Cyclobacteriaceae bacterium]|nr:endonuclease/exonuclease/phosphatase family protein [Cyclobacteriaceae bacterium]